VWEAGPEATRVLLAYPLCFCLVAVKAHSSQISVQRRSTGASGGETGGGWEVRATLSWGLLLKGPSNGDAKEDSEQEDDEDTEEEWPPSNLRVQFTRIDMAAAAAGASSASSSSSSEAEASVWSAAPGEQGGGLHSGELTAEGSCGGGHCFGYMHLVQ